MNQPIDRNEDIRDVFRRKTMPMLRRRKVARVLRHGRGTNAIATAVWRTLMFNGCSNRQLLATWKRRPQCVAVELSTPRTEP